VRQLMLRLARMDNLVEIAQTTSTMRQRLPDYRDCAQPTAESGHNRFAAAALRDRIGTGRVLAIEILEFFAGFLQPAAGV
jgi:hypothetical protein